MYVDFDVFYFERAHILYLNTRMGIGNESKCIFQVVVGDQDGIVQLFSMKKDELIIHFKTLPAEKVQSIHLGGALGIHYFTEFQF